MARRRSHVARRMQKIRGVPGEEKQLLIRVGELIDAIINNRNPANPQAGNTKNVRDPRLPPTTSMTSEPSVRGVMLEWPKVDSSLLLYYELEITNTDTGVTETKISYTNRISFKGRIGGTYKAKIKSIGRNGTASPPFEQEFFVTDDVMLLEGTKNGFNTVGNQVTEDLFLTEGHKVFAWAHCVLDKLIGGTNGNPVLAYRLYRTPTDATFTDPRAVLLEEVTTFSAGVTSTNIDDNAFAIAIDRPSLSAPADSDPTFLRGTTLETTHSIMFTPFTVDSTIANQTWDFVLVAVGRELNEDLVNLSLSMWTAFEGQSGDIPGDPFVPEPPIVRLHEKSIRLHNGQANEKGAPISANPDERKLGEYLRGIVTNPFRMIGPDWTFAAWIKLGDKGGTAASPTFTFFDDELIGSPLLNPSGTLLEKTNKGGSSEQAKNRIRVLAGTNPTGGEQFMQLRVIVGSDDGLSEVDWFHRDASTGRPGNSGPWGPNRTVPILTNTGAFAFPNGPGEWNFITVFFRSDEGINVYVDGIQITDNVGGGPVAITHGFDTNQVEYVMGTDLDSVTDGSGGFNGPGGPSVSFPEALDCFIHKAAFWNYCPGNAITGGGDSVNALQLGWHQTLFNNNDGSSVDWFENSSDLLYDGAGNITHYWQMGAVTSSTEDSSAIIHMARDTGLNPGGFGENWDENGDADLSNTGSTDLIETSDRAEHTERDFRRGMSVDFNVVDDHPTADALYDF